MTKEVDLRALFAGDDPARRVREGAADLMDRALRNTERREREQALHKYTRRDTLPVRVEQVQYNPPLWRMTTLCPLGDGIPAVHVDERNPHHLEAEMRIKVRSALLQAGYFDKPGVTVAEQYQEASAWVSAMKIERSGGVILLRDSQRHHREFNR